MPDCKQEKGTPSSQLLPVSSQYLRNIDSEESRAKIEVSTSFIFTHKNVLDKKNVLACSQPKVLELHDFVKFKAFFAKESSVKKTLVYISPVFENRRAPSHSNTDCQTAVDSSMAFHFKGFALWRCLSASPSRKTSFKSYIFASLSAHNM